MPSGNPEVVLAMLLSFSQGTLCSFFPSWAQQNGSYKKGGKKKGYSAINKVVTKEYTIHIHKRIHTEGCKRHGRRALKEIQKFAMKKMGTPDVCIDTGLNKAVWANGMRSIPYLIWVL